jgi:hypothetical protein
LDLLGATRSEGHSLCVGEMNVCDCVSVSVLCGCLLCNVL